MAAPNIAQHRLHSQQIARPTWTDPSQTVAWLGAVQAQDYAGASWAVALRTRAATRATVVHAFAQGSLVRTWLMRGTLQIVAAADLRWLVALLGPREIAKSQRRYQQLELDAEVFSRSHAVLSRVLANGQQMTRAALSRALQDAGISANGQRGYHILRHAALSGLICFGPMQEKQETYVLIDDWARGAHAPMAHGEALGMLAARYFCGHGPATLQDFIWWSGLTMADARTAVEAARDQLQQSTVDDQIYWFGLNDPQEESASPSVQLLPAYDEFYLGYQRRDAVLDSRYDRRAVSNAGVFRPIIVIDGQIVGIWRERVGRGDVALTPILFRPLRSREAQALEAAADRYGTYLALPVHLTDEAQK